MSSNLVTGYAGLRTYRWQGAVVPWVLRLVGITVAIIRHVS